MTKKVENSGDERLENVESALSRTELFIEKHQNIILIVVGLIVVGVMAFFGIKKYYLEPREQEACSQLFAAQRYFENQAYENALNGDGNNLGFLDVINEYGSTKSGKLAAYYAGISYMKIGNYQEAINFLKKFNGKDSVIAPMALGAIGDCYMELDNVKEAINYYGKAANKDNNEFTAPLFLQKQAIAYEIDGNKAKAVETYKLIKKNYPLSNEAVTVDKNIANLK